MKKRIISTILALSLVFSAFSCLCLNAFAGEKKTDRTIPYIHVSGYMTSDIYMDESDPESGTVYPPTSGNIVKCVAKLLPAIFLRMITGDYDKFSDRLCDALLTVLGPAMLDNNGDVSNKSGAGFVYPSREEIIKLTKEGRIRFDYDWRADPFVSAEKLSDFIDYVIECTGAPKVILESHSFGGVVITTYVELHGTGKLYSVLYNASAACGETFTAELAKGQVKLDAEGLTEYLKGVFAHQNGEKFLNGLFRVLYKTGITGKICNGVNRVFEKCHDKIFRKVIYPVFANWPGIWAMVPDEYFDEAYNAVFNEFYKNDGIDHSKMIKKINRYNTEIRANRDRILDEINSDCNLYIVCRYGYCAMFCTPSWKLSSDLVVDVKYASFGATVAPYGETLSEDYLKKADKKYISPDKMIDASTCKFPQQTWFVSDYMHMWSVVDNLFEKLVYSDEQLTVDSLSECPRFLTYDMVENL